MNWGINMNTNQCPRSKALTMIDDGRVGAEQMLEMCLAYMSHDDVEDMLDANELTDRFFDDD